MASLESYIASVDIFAGDFAPRQWAICAGQLIPISQNQALFSLIGTFYGGDGRASFALPDLRGRVPIGMGQGPGLSDYKIGQRGGAEGATLTLLTLPQHTHIAEFTPAGGGSLTGTVALPVKTGLGAGGNNPNGKYLGTSGNANIYFDAPTDGSNMAPADVVITGGGTGGTVTVGETGGSQPFSILQPFLALNFIICLQGIFPSRN